MLYTHLSFTLEGLVDCIFIIVLDVQNAAFITKQDFTNRKIDKGSFECNLLIMHGCFNCKSF